MQAGMPRSRLGSLTLNSPAPLHQIYANWSQVTKRHVSQKQKPLKYVETDRENLGTNPLDRQAEGPLFLSLLGRCNEVSMPP